MRQFIAPAIVISLMIVVAFVILKISNVLAISWWWISIPVAIIIIIISILFRLVLKLHKMYN